MERGTDALGPIRASRSWSSRGRDAHVLVGGATLSAVRYARQPGQRHRFTGNVLIAVGALLPGIGGSATRFGHTEVLYVTELIGLVLILAGYRRIVGARGAAPAVLGLAR